MTVLSSSSCGSCSSKPDGVALAHGDLADIVLVHARDDAQQGGFAGAVQAEHADLGAVIEAERDIAQDLLVGGMDAPDAHHGVNDLGIGWHGTWF